ncbi:hypothetical protein JCM10207_001505 [Rhodosporidiobolus poonsookiae]
MHKAAHIVELNATIDSQKTLIEALQVESSQGAVRRDGRRSVRLVRKAEKRPPPSDKPTLGAGLENLLVSSLLRSASIPTTTVQGGKEPLSLQTTSVNFRRFVQKSGPIFVAQDAVEAVVRWEDPAKTAFFAAAWALLCYWPSLALFIPNLILISILLTTYQARRAAGPPPESQDGPTGLAANPPTEGSVDYLANLQNIQIMMGRVADLTDVLRSLVPYLTWRDERLTRALLHLACISSVALALAAHFLPFRLLFLIAGEAVFVLGHPLAQSLIASASKTYFEDPGRAKKRAALMRRLLEDDALGDEELEMEVVEVQKVEFESRAPSAEGGWVSEAVVGAELPEGFKWLGEWEDAAPLDGAVDADGWTYIHLDGSRTSTPSIPGEKGPVFAQSRRRRMTRRAIRNPLL